MWSRKWALYSFKPKNAEEVLLPASCWSACRLDLEESSLTFVVRHRREEKKLLLWWEIKMTPRTTTKWTCCCSYKFLLTSTDVSCVLLHGGKPSPCPAIYSPKYIHGFQHSFLFFSLIKTRYLHLPSSVGFFQIYEGLTLEQWIYPLFNPLSFGDSTAGSTNPRKALDLVSALMSSAGIVFYFFIDLHWWLWWRSDPLAQSVKLYHLFSAHNAILSMVDTFQDKLLHVNTGALIPASLLALMVCDWWGSLFYFYSQEFRSFQSFPHIPQKLVQVTELSCSY